MPQLSDVALLVYPHRTTSSAIAIQNLNVSIDSFRRRWLDSQSTSAATELVAALELRAQLLGTIGDLPVALEVARASVENHPDDPNARLLLAGSLIGLHRFAEASATLDVSERLGGDVRAARDALAVALGVNYDAALEARLAAVLTHPSYQTHTAAAAALVAAGRFVEADAAFVAALEGYRDVSPFAVAWVQFQRGALWGESIGRDDIAEALYRDAVRLVPGFVVANVHLAELEAASGNERGAIARLRAVTGDGDGDPEPWSRLAEYLAPSDPAAAAEAAQHARQRYDTLLAENELAFADHAAEFFLGAGADPQRAFTLTELNLANRRTDRSFELAITAALAIDDPERACEILSDAGVERRRVGLVEYRTTLDCQTPQQPTDGRRD